MRVRTFVLCSTVVGCSLPLPAPETVVDRTEPLRRVRISRDRFLVYCLVDARGNLIPYRQIGSGYCGIINEVCADIYESDYVVVSRWYPEWPCEPVYEYRSGLLIPGKRDSWCRFVPERGGRVSSFRDYRAGNGAPRIYNLPGHLLPKDEK